MKYIRISNDGLIEPQALHLVGASTKRNDATKIGQFGSGNKYAMAYLLRNNYDLIVYSGTKEIKITTEKELFRENEFNVIFIDGVKTSITTEMGKDWKFWQAIREIYCNAIDEGNFKLDFVTEIEPKEGQTHFYIDTKKDVMEFVGNFDNYFATNKKVLFESSFGRILEKSGDAVNVYRKGVKCYDSKDALKSLYDYDFFDINIDENRLVQYYWEVEEKLWQLIYSCDNKEIIMNVLHGCSDRNLIEGNFSSVTYLNSSKISDVFKQCLNEINLAPSGYAGLLNPDEIHNHVIIPTKLFENIRPFVKDENVGDKFKVMKDGVFMRDIEPTTLQSKILSDAMYFLKECGFEIPYKINTCIFDEKNVLGCAYKDEIFISDICIEKGVNEVVNTIIEEFIHIKYKVKDNSRGFQTSIITEFISYMKKVNSFSI